MCTITKHLDTRWAVGSHPSSTVAWPTPYPGYQTFPRYFRFSLFDGSAPNPVNKTMRIFRFLGAKR